jgi:hypothetical protein
MIKFPSLAPFAPVSISVIPQSCTRDSGSGCTSFRLVHKSEMRKVEGKIHSGRFSSKSIDSRFNCLQRPPHLDSSPCILIRTSDPLHVHSSEATPLVPLSPTATIWYDLVGTARSARPVSIKHGHYDLDHRAKDSSQSPRHPSSGPGGPFLQSGSLEDYSVARVPSPRHRLLRSEDS